MDYRTGNLKPVKEPSRKDLALMVIQAEEERERLTSELDDARRTKAHIGSNREATAMARASSETRRANKLERLVGDSDLPRLENREGDPVAVRCLYDFEVHVSASREKAQSNIG